MTRIIERPYREQLFMGINSSEHVRMAEVDDGETTPDEYHETSDSPTPVARVST